VKGTVKSVDAKGAVVDLGDGVEASLKASEISRDRVEDARNHLKEGDEVEARIISVDRKNRAIALSIKAKDAADEKEAIKSLNQVQESAAPKTIGDLIKQQLNADK
jgi:small subunit ribosomal protein S1